jgi:hypothetical protein
LENVFQKKQNNHEEILRGYTSSDKISNDKTFGFRDIITSQIYSDESVPKCAPMADYPAEKTIYKWGGKKYMKVEVIKGKYSGRTTFQDCGDMPRPTPEKYKKDFQVCAYALDKILAVFYKREGAIINGELRYATNWQEYSNSPNSCDNNQIILKDSNSFVEVVALKIHPKYRCYTNRGRITLNSPKRIELSGCSSR